MALQQVNAATQINPNTQVPTQAQVASLLMAMLMGGR
jgi:hypothetical protein